MDRKNFPTLPIIGLVVLLGAGSAIAWLFLRPESTVDPKDPTPESPRPVERVEAPVTPERFRKQGRTYAVKVIMNLNGRANHEDWGLETVLTVNYVVTLRYDETVILSEPKKLIVERHFRESRSRLFASVEDMNLSSDLERAWEMLDYVAMVEPRVGQVKGVAGKAAIKIKEKLMEESKRLNLNWSPILEKVGRDPAQVVKTLANKLEGRKIKMLWTEGTGVEVLGGADGLPEKERRLLERASLLADGALFPNKNKRHGESWTVDAVHFSDFLDLGLDGNLRGKVRLRRDADEDVEGQRCATLKMLGGTIDVIKDDASQELRGSLNPSGTLYYDLDDDLIRSAVLTGKAKASFVSRDHLLFKAKFKGTPVFTVSYEATLK